MTWSAERLTGVWPANHWRIAQGERVLVVRGADDDVMHVVEALDAYEQPVADEPVELRPCLASMGVHDCVLLLGHEGPHACDDECDAGGHLHEGELVEAEA